MICKGFCKLSASSPPCARPTLTAGTPRPSAGGLWPRCSPTSPRRLVATTPTGRWRSGARGWSTSGKSWPLIGQDLLVLASDWSISGRPGARRLGQGVSTAARVTRAPGRAGPGHAARTGAHGTSITAGEPNSCHTTSTTAHSLTPCSGQ